MTPLEQRVGFLERHCRELEDRLKILETIVQKGQSDVRSRKVLPTDIAAVEERMATGVSLLQACDQLGLRYSGVHKALSRMRRAKQCRSLSV
jgi:hypothetical protein